MNKVNKKILKHSSKKLKKVRDSRKADWVRQEIHQPYPANNITNAEECDNKEEDAASRLPSL